MRALDATGITAAELLDGQEMQSVRRSMGEMLTTCWERLVAPVLASYPDLDPSGSDYTPSFLPDDNGAKVR